MKKSRAGPLATHFSEFRAAVTSHFLANSRKAFRSLRVLGFPAAFWRARDAVEERFSITRCLSDESLFAFATGKDVNRVTRLLRRGRNEGDLGLALDAGIAMDSRPAAGACDLVVHVLRAGLRGADKQAGQE
jgi:hypothetical protein